MSPANPSFTFLGAQSVDLVMEKAMIQLDSVDLMRREVVTTSGLTLRITDVFDGRGFITRNYACAVACIADNNGDPMYIKLCDFDKRALH